MLINMPTPRTIIRLLILLVVFCFPDAVAGRKEAKKLVSLVNPPTGKVVVRDNVLPLLLDVDPERVTAVTVYAPWDSTIQIDLTESSDREDLLDTFSRTIPHTVLLRQLVLQSSAFHQPATRWQDQFSLQQKQSARETVLEDTSRAVVKALRTWTGYNSRLQISGWIPLTFERSEFQKRCKEFAIATSVTLFPGVNLIPIEVLGLERKRIAVDTMEAFYFAEVAGIEIPEGYVATTFHTKENEARCISCHAPSASEPLKCESCHRATTAQPHVHSLFGSGDCTVCHQTDQGSGHKPTYAPEAEGEACVQCHDGVATDTKKEVLHAPLMSGQCSTCHSPHASPYANQLRMPVNDVCSSCHPEKKAGNHPIMYHPVSGAPDPVSEGKELRCASCHSPHGSSQKALLTSAGGYFQLCQSCHKK
jgi:predicted CXXCH cytochrome family protein